MFNWKNLVKKLALNFGYVLTPSSFWARRSMSGALRQLAKYYKPDIIFDVGAAFGDWSRECLRFFPQSKYFLLEPLAEYQRKLTELVANNSNLTYIPAAANWQAGKIEFNVHADLVGSSLKREAEGGGVDGTRRIIDSVTLDDIETKYNLSGRCLIKIDVQGAELDVLRGAKRILEKTDCLVLEVSFYRSFLDGPDLFDVICFMKDRGFVVYDFASVLYRPYDDALSQVDLVFVREGSAARQFSGYATPAQRTKQNEDFKNKFNRG